MTLSELAEQIAEEFGDDYSDSDVATQYQRWAQQALDEVASAGRWHFMNYYEDQTIGGLDDAGQVLSTLEEIVAVYLISTNVNGESTGKLPYATIERIIANGIDPYTPGDGPIQYWYYGEQDDNNPGDLVVRFAPQVDGVGGDSRVFRFYGIRKPPQYGADDDILMPVPFILVAKDAIRAKVHLNENQIEAATTLRNLFFQGLELLSARFSAQAPQPDPSASKLFLSRVSQSPGSPEGAN